MGSTEISLLAHVVVGIGFIIRAVLRPHREPASRIAWVAVIATVPAFGIVAYILFGQVNIGRRRVAKVRRVLEQMPAVAGCAAGDEANFTASPRSDNPLRQHGRPQHQERLDESPRFSQDEYAAGHAGQVVLDRLHFTAPAQRAVSPYHTVDA